MMHLFLVFLILFSHVGGFLVTVAQANTYYISPSGSNSNNGSSGAPWLTWAFAINAARATCGDTLIAKDGTYGNGTTGMLIINNLNCSAGNMLTIQAENEFLAFLDSQGQNYGIRTFQSSYIALSGFRVGSGDYVTSNQYSTIQFRSSHHIELRRCLAQYNNRQQNTHMVELYFTNDSLVEECQIYDWHRHGYIVENGDRNTFRRNYANSRLRDSIPGGYDGSSGSNHSGDNCFTIYPGSNNLMENNICDGQVNKGYSIEANGGTGTINNQFYGNISFQTDKGMVHDVRGGSLLFMPQDTLSRDFVAVVHDTPGLFGTGTQRDGFATLSAKNSQCINCSSFGVPLGGFRAAVSTANPGDGAPSTFLTNTLVMNATGNGYSMTGSGLTWTGTNVDAYNSAAYSPSSSGNWVSKFTTDPQMGTCYAWRPDGSNAKVNNWGADILYRYNNGVLTGERLWDQNTGAFPGSTTLISGVNDVAGSSLFDFPTRFNINSGGCSFPSGYASGAPSNPANYGVAEGTTSTTHSITIPAGTDSLSVCVAGYSVTQPIGQTTAVDSSGEALALVGHSVSPNFLRFVDLWQKLNPSSGSRTVTVSSSGNVSGLVTTSAYHDNVLAYNISAQSAGVGTVMPLTVPTSSSETILNCLAAGKQFTLTAGDDQTIETQTDHTTQPLRLAVSEQAGSDGGDIEWFNSDTTEWTQLGVSLSAVDPFPPASYTFTLSKCRFEGRGTEASPVLWTSDCTTPYYIGPDGMFRLRMEVSAGLGSTNPARFQLWCRKNADSYTRAMNDFGSNSFRLYGNGQDSGLPASGVLTTDQFGGGNFKVGVVNRDENSSTVITSMTSTQRTELLFIGVLDPSALVPGQDVINCRPQLDSGVPLDAHTVNPTMNIIPWNAGF